MKLPPLAALRRIAVLTHCSRRRSGPTAADETVDMPTLLSVSGSAAFIGKQALESVQRWRPRSTRRAAFAARCSRFAARYDVHASDRGPVAQRTDQRARASGLRPTFTANAVRSRRSSRRDDRLVLLAGRASAGRFVHVQRRRRSDSMAHSIATYFPARLHAHCDLSSTDASGKISKRTSTRRWPSGEQLDELVGREHFATSDISVAAQIAASNLKSADADRLDGRHGLGVALHAVHDVGLDVPIMAGNAHGARAAHRLRSLLAEDAHVPRILGMTRSRVRPPA